MHYQCAAMCALGHMTSWWVLNWTPLHIAFYTLIKTFLVKNIGNPWIETPLTSITSELDSHCSLFLFDHLTYPWRAPYFSITNTKFLNPAHRYLFFLKMDVTVVIQITNFLQKLALPIF